MSDNLTVFNPDASAALMKLRVRNHVRLTQDIVAELYRAREYYSNSGHRSDLATDDARLQTFGQYLDEIGLHRRTSERWLERYVPEENKLLTYEEFSEKKSAEARAKLSEEERQRSVVAEFRKTGVKPVGWTPKLDKAVKDTDEHLAKVKADREKEEAEREQRAKERNESAKTYTLHSDDFRLASNALAQKLDQREEWKEKIRLSDGGKEDAFMDAIIDYMETLPNDNRRIEACNNIIKICRNIAVELQRVSAL